RVGMAFFRVIAGSDPSLFSDDRIATESSRGTARRRNRTAQSGALPIARCRGGERRTKPQRSQRRTEDGKALFSVSLCVLCGLLSFRCRPTGVRAEHSHILSCRQNRARTRQYFAPWKSARAERLAQMGNRGL